MTYEGIIFDFDGVLIESEWEGNRHLAELLTELGHPTTTGESLDNFMGLGGRDFHAAVERWLGKPIPARFHELRDAEDARALAEGVGAVPGAVDFVRSLPADLPVAIASSSSSAWIAAHLDHIGLRGRFGGMFFSGREHVTRGKPAPDLYWHAAAALGTAIERTVVIEDSPVGVTGAVASGARVIGLAAGRHCAPGHGERLRALGAHHVATSFDELALLIAPPPSA